MVNMDGFQEIYIYYLNAIYLIFFRYSLLYQNCILPIWTLSGRERVKVGVRMDADFMLKHRI